MSFDSNLRRFTEDIKTMVTRSHDLQRDFLNYVGKEVINYLREITPKDSGDTANAWKIMDRTDKSITIGNTREGVLLHILEGVKGGQKVYPKHSKVFKFDIGGQEIFTAFFTTKTIPERNFMKGVVKNLDHFNEALMEALVSKYWKVFEVRSVVEPSGIKLRNITATVGLGQGTSRNTNRGRGRISLNRVRTGRKTNRRRLTVVRRRTGQFISSKEVRAK